MSSGGAKGGTTTQIQKADPWEGLQPHLRSLFGEAEKAFNATPKNAYGGNFIAPTNPAQAQGAQGLINVGQQNLGAGNAAIKLGQDTAAGKYLDPSAYVNPAIEATIRPMLTQARNYILPGVGSAATNSDAYGGSRHQMVLKDTTDSILQNVADTSAKMTNDAIDRERRLQYVAPETIGQGLSLNAAPYNLMSQGGGQQQQLGQQVIDNNLMKYKSAQEAPWIGIPEYANILASQGSLGGVNTGTMTSPGTSGLSAGLSGAAAGGLGGWGLASAFPATFAGPWGPAVIGGGALLGGLLGTAR